jgi:hypothetical protein
MGISSPQKYVTRQSNGMALDTAEGTIMSTMQTAVEFRIDEDQSSSNSISLATTSRHTPSLWTGW